MDNNGTLRIYSFGYGHEEPLPETPDITADVRTWFKDPHIDPTMRYMDGRDVLVFDNVFHTPGAYPFSKGLYQAAWTLLQLAGDRTVILAIGCVGGRHRSVALARMVAQHARRQGWTVEVIHRDVDKPVLNRSVKITHPMDTDPFAGTGAYDCDGTETCASDTHDAGCFSQPAPSRPAGQ